MALGSNRRQSHTWSSVPTLRHKRSEFDESHGHKTTFDSGYLIPFYVQEVMPGDSHRVNANMFARLATLQKPIMDNLYMETQFFFVPNRLTWDNWERMWGAQDNPGDSTDYLVPIIADLPAVTENTIWDYLGIPLGVAGIQPNALPLRAINLIYNEWYRDENLQLSVVEERGDSDTQANYTLLRRGKRHDYFTSALPFPQKGPEVLLPLAGTVPVRRLISGDDGYTDGVPKWSFAGGADTNTIADFAGVNISTGTAQVPFSVQAWGTDTQLGADLGGLGGSASINDLRQAIVVQQFYEMLARGGSRYTEMLQAVYGVSNGDARLQRPEYLGGGRTNIFVNPVVNTAGLNSIDPGFPAQGDLAGYGVGSATGTTHGFSKSFTEHGYIIGFCSVRADLNYQQGLERFWSRRTKFDFPIPHFANLGEQAILNKEIFTQGPAVLNPQGTPVDDDVFGYVGRYDDSRYRPNKITGSFRSTAATSLDIWHLAQDFADLPTLSPTFIVENPPVDRIISVPSEPQLLLDTWIQQHSVRELPMWSVPGVRRV
jgi:hypothetical protein